MTKPSKAARELLIALFSSDGTQEDVDNAIQYAVGPLVEATTPFALELLRSWEDEEPITVLPGAVLSKITIGDMRRLRTTRQPWLPEKEE